MRQGNLMNCQENNEASGKNINSEKFYIFQSWAAAIWKVAPLSLLLLDVKSNGAATRDGADNKKCIRMLRCVRKLCPHAAPHRIQTQLSSRCTAPHRKLNIF